MQPSHLEYKGQSSLIQILRTPCHSGLIRLVFVMVRDTDLIDRLMFSVARFAVKGLLYQCINLPCLSHQHFIAVCTPQFYRIVHSTARRNSHSSIFDKKEKNESFLKCKTKTTTMSIRLLLQIYNMRNTPRDANVVHFVVLQTKKRFLFDVHLWLSAVSQKSKVYF